MLDFISYFRASGGKEQLSGGIPRPHICPAIFQLKKKIVSFQLKFTFLISNGRRKTKLVLTNTGTVNFELVANAVLENTKAKFKK